MASTYSIGVLAHGRPNWQAHSVALLAYRCLRELSCKRGHLPAARRKLPSGGQVAGKLRASGGWIDLQIVQNGSVAT